MLGIVLLVRRRGVVLLGSMIGGIGHMLRRLMVLRVVVVVLPSGRMPMQHRPYRGNAGHTVAVAVAVVIHDDGDSLDKNVDTDLTQEAGRKRFKKVLGRSCALTGRGAMAEDT